MRKFIHFVLPILMVSAFSACTATVEMPTGSDTSAASMSESTATEETTAAESAETVSEQTETESAEKAVLDFSSIDSLVNSMTLEEKIGQILLARFPDSGAESIMEQYQIGGYTLYAKDFESETPETMLEKTQEIQKAAKIPAFLATDEEGGTVVRVSKFPQYRLTPFSSQISLAREGEELIESETAEKAQLLSSIGINFNLAPVVDITDNHLDYIYERTFGEDAETTGEYAALIVKVMNENNVGSCLKHFPGYGSNVDTHTGIAVDERSAASFEANDLVPFKYGIEAGVPSIMVNHNIITAYDSELPASLSPAVHELLRNDLGFEGVIITDDLGMDAITLYAGEESPYVLAITAGNDMLCTSDIEAAYSDIINAVNNGKIEESRLDESVKRIIAMKKNLGIVTIGE